MIKKTDHLTSTTQRYDTDPPSHTPTPGLVLHVFFSSCASLQIIFHAAPSKKRLVIPYDRPFKQKCRDAGGLCSGYTGSGAGSKSASYQRHFYVNARSCKMWSYHAIWRIASACCNVDASVTVLVGGCRDAVPGVSRRCHRSIGGWFQKISILGDQPSTGSHIWNFTFC